MTEHRNFTGHRPGGRKGPRGPVTAGPEPKLDAARVVEEARRYVELAIREMGLSLEYDITQPASEGATGQTDVVIMFRGEDEPLLLEKNGEFLLALEHVAHRWLRLDPRLHDRVRFDCGDFRATRVAELKLSARVAAQRVRETGQVFRFNPMSSRERRIIHLELTGAQGVRTISEGSGDRRQLVIYPAGKETGRRGP